MSIKSIQEAQLLQERCRRYEAALLKIINTQGPKDSIIGNLFRNTESFKTVQGIAKQALDNSY